MERETNCQKPINGGKALPRQNSNSVIRGILVAWGGGGKDFGGGEGG